MIEDSRIRICLPQRRKDAKSGRDVISTGLESLDPSHSLGMTGMGSSTLRLGAFAGDSSAFGCSCSPTRRTSFFQRSLGKSVYYYASRFARQAQILWPHKTSQTRRFLPPRREERQVRITIFFAAFASLREIFRIFGCGFAALGALRLTSPTPKSSAPQVSGSNGPSRSTGRSVQTVRTIVTV